MREALGHHFEGNRLAFTLAQTYLETGKWEKIFNWNVGNITAGQRWTGAAYSWEDRVPSTFRAYGNLAEGVDDYAAELRDRYPSILKAADTGRASAVAQAISESGYCRGCFGPDETKGLEQLAKRFGAKGPRGGGIAGALGIVFLLAYVAGRLFRG